MGEADPKAPDLELVRAALADRNSFAPLVARYEPRLRKYVTPLGSLDPETAKDILQESFIKAYINLNDYDHASIQRMVVSHRTQRDVLSLPASEESPSRS